MSEVVMAEIELPNTTVIHRKSSNAASSSTDPPVIEEITHNHTDEEEQFAPLITTFASSKEGDDLNNQLKDGEEIKDINSFIAVCLIILMGDMSRGVTFPTLWSFVQLLGGTEKDQGFIVAAFSFGRVVISPYFGRITDRMGYKFIFRISISVLGVGALIYSQANNLHLLMLAQLTLGVGSGTLGVSRAYVSEMTAKNVRAKYIGWLTAIQYIGFTCTPFIGAVFSKYLYIPMVEEEILYNHPPRIPKKIDAFSAPGYFMFICCCATFIIVNKIFNDIPPSSIKIPPKGSNSKIEEKSFVTPDREYYIAIGTCIFLNIVCRGCIAIFETIGTKTALSSYGMSATRTGTIVSTCGLIGVATLLSMGKIEKYLSNVQVVCIGLALMLLGCLLMVTFSQMKSNWSFVLTIFLVYSIGFPAGSTSVITLMSKIVRSDGRAYLFGWFGSAGSLARISFPILTGLLSSNNLNILFLTITIILSVSLLLVLRKAEMLMRLSSM